MKLIKQLFCLFITLFSIVGKSYGGDNQSKKLVDPMMPKTMQEEKKESTVPANKALEVVTETLHLKAIAYDDDKSYCIINDQLLTVDDVINDYTVYEITTEEVILIDKNKKLKKLIIY